MASPHHKPPVILFLALICALIFVSASTVAAEANITPLTAAQLALARVQALVAGKKLNPGWDDDFSSLQVSMRNIKGFSEYVVQINRSSGHPASLQFYFDMAGVYTGASQAIGAGEGGTSGGS